MSARPGYSPLMCSALEFAGTVSRFADRLPRLPVLLRDGSGVWHRWGCPYTIDTREVPHGACARLESIRDLKWRRWRPRPVQIPAARYMERDTHRTEHWFDVPTGFVIQGLAIQHTWRHPRPCVEHAQYPEMSEQVSILVYVVTIPAEGGVLEVHDRMPRPMKNGLT